MRSLFVPVSSPSLFGIPPKHPPRQPPAVIQPHRSVRLFCKASGAELFHEFSVDRADGLFKVVFIHAQNNVQLA